MTNNIKTKPKKSSHPVFPVNNQTNLNKQISKQTSTACKYHKWYQQLKRNYDFCSILNQLFMFDTCERIIFVQISSNLSLVKDANKENRFQNSQNSVLLKVHNLSAAMNYEQVQFIADNSKFKYQLLILLIFNMLLQAIIFRIIATAHIEPHTVIIWPVLILKLCQI